MNMDYDLFNFLFVGGLVTFISLTVVCATLCACCCPQLIFDMEEESVVDSKMAWPDELAGIQNV